MRGHDLAESYSEKFGISTELARVLVELEEREVERGESYNDIEKESRRVCRLDIWLIGIIQN